MAATTGERPQIILEARNFGALESVVTWGASAAPYLIATPMAIFGAQHFIYHDFVANYIPGWIPWRMFWAGFTGIALLAAAAGIVTRKCDRWAAMLLGLMIFLWVLLLHTSRIAASPRDFGEWRGIFQALAMSGCSFALGGRVGQNDRKQSALADAGAVAAPYMIGVAMTALGILHFIFPNVAAPQTPVWIPGTPSANYWSGAALFLLGIGICLPRARPAAAAWLGLLIFASMLAVHLPFVLNAARFESDWTKTLVMSGGAFLLARNSRGNGEIQAREDGRIAIVEQTC